MASHAPQDLQLEIERIKVTGDDGQNVITLYLWTVHIVHMNSGFAQSNNVFLKSFLYVSDSEGLIEVSAYSNAGM